MVLVSAKKRENLDALLETILLTSDILNLRASLTRLASGVVLEAKLDRGRGPVATVLVQQGTLRNHEPFIVGQIFGRVRAMFNDKGEALTEAGPATPVVRLDGRPLEHAEAGDDRLEVHLPDGVRGGALELDFGEDDEPVRYELRIEHEGNGHVADPWAPEAVR